MTARPRRRDLALVTTAGFTGALTEVPAARSRRRRRSRLSLWLVFLCAAYILYSFIYLGLKIYRVEQELAAYRQQKIALLEEQARLEQEIRKLNSDAYIEKVAREQLGLIKPGETVILTARPAEDVPPYVPPPPGHEFRD